MDKKVLKKILVASLILNLLGIILLSYIVFRYSLTRRFTGKILSITGNYSYKDNAIYHHQIRLYEIYRKQKADAVMLGDSITYGVNWNELLDKDIANRGIALDIVDGMERRLEYLYKLNPKICFIMGGINDISHKIPIQDIFQSYKKVVEELKRHSIIPIIQSTLYTSNPNANIKVKELNEILSQYAVEHNIDFVDLNTALSRNDRIIQEYTYDGIHLNSRGYKIWAEQIEYIFRKYGL